MPRRSVQAQLEAAVAIAEAAGPIALRYFRRPLAVHDKAAGSRRFDPVTQADRRIEAFMRAELARRFPGDGVLGEEAGEQRGVGPRRWVLDPIDGTRAFITGMPAWGILLGLAEGERCLLGVMHQPFLRETFVGSAAGAWLRHAGTRRRLRARGAARLADAVLYCTHPENFGSRADRQAFARVAAACRMTRYGGDCYAYCLLALGQIDLIIEGNLQPYDIIPLIPIIEAAGGVVTDARGGPAHHGGLIVTAANSRLHAQALARMQRR
jgi:myo-inositol-1(or 4)-monophosphatase